MKNKPKIIFITAFCLSLFQNLKAQTSDEILNLLTNKGVITKAEADSLHNEALKKASDEKSNQKSFNVLSSKYLQLGGFAQFRYQANQQSDVPDGFDIFRVRLDLKGSILPKLDYRMMVEFAGTPKLTDVYVTYKPFDFFKLQVGQFKIPFSLESNYADDKMELINRSQVVEALVARSTDVIGNQLGRDIGLMGFGNFIKTNDHFLFDYYLSILNGQGINTTDKNNAKDFAGRLVIHPFKGLSIGSSVYDGYDYISSTAANIVRLRYGGELAYTLKRFAVSSEYIWGKNDTVTSEGFYVQASCFLIPKKFQLVLKYDTYDSNKGIATNATYWYITGLNYYFKDAVKLQLNYTYKKEAGGSSEQFKNDLIAVLFQIGF